MVRVRDLRVPLSSRKLPHSPSIHPFAPQRMTPAQHRVIVDLIDATRPHRVIVDLKSRRRSRPAADSPSRQPRRRTARPRSPRHASRRGRTETSRHAGASPPRAVAPPLCRHAAAQREAPSSLQGRARLSCKDEPVVLGSSLLFLGEPVVPSRPSTTSIPHHSSTAAPRAGGGLASRTGRLGRASEARPSAPCEGRETLTGVHNERTCTL